MRPYRPFSRVCDGVVRLHGIIHLIPRGRGRVGGGGAVIGRGGSAVRFTLLHGLRVLSISLWKFLHSTIEKKNQDIFTHNHKNLYT